MATADAAKPEVHEAFDVAEIVGALSQVELARPMETPGEVDRDFAHAYGAALDHQLEPDLVSDGVEVVRG